MATNSAATIAEGMDAGCQAVSHKLLVMAGAQEMLACHMYWRTGIAMRQRFHTQQSYI